MKLEQLKVLVIECLEDMKARDIKVLNVAEISGFTDYMVVCTGGSNRQVKAIADNLAVSSKKAGVKPHGIEGQQSAEWILIDLGDIIVHVMQQNARDFYQLEKLWDPELAQPDRQESSST